MSLDSWNKDWDNSDDAVYDGPDEEQLEAKKRREAFNELRKIDEEIYNSYEDKELYWAHEHWINNPLIKPKSKVHLFEQWEERIRKEQNEHIVELLEEIIIKGGNHGWSISTIIGILNEEIKGENK